MTEADGDERHADEADERADDRDDLKDDSTSAEEPSVYDGIAGQPRLTWSSVTDTGGGPRPAADRSEPADRSSFRFDLGGALARLGGDDESPTEPEARVEPEVAPEPPAAPVDQPLPQAEPAPEPQPAPSDEPLIRRLDASFSSSTTDAPPNDDEPLIDLGRLEPAIAEPVAPMEPVAATPPVVDRPAVERQVEPQAVGAPVIESRVEPSVPEIDYPRRVPGAHLDPRHRIDDDGDEASGVSDTVMPEIHEATSVDDVPKRVAARPSVFGEVDPYDPSVRGRGAGAPSLPGAPAGGMPTLPAANPAAPPAVVEPVASATSTPDITALRSAQLKAKRQQRQGKLFGRSLLAFVVVGGVIAASMMFGRSLLFSTDWDVQLTPIVNEIEADRGAPFESTVSLSTIDSAEFGDRLRAATIGDGWVDRVPEWRALNLTVGTVTAESVAAEMVRETTAFFDAGANTILLVDGVDVDTSRADLRLALESAYDRQQGATADVADVDAAAIGFVGVSAPQVIAERAIDNFLANRTAEREPANESLPIPIAYQLAAVNTLGEPILVAAGIDPTTLTLASPAPEAIGNVLSDEPVNTASGLLQPGDRSVSDPVALGTDDWSLAWATRLPESTVARLVEQVSADSYRAVERNGNVCVIGVFETANDADGSAVFAAMLTWVAAAPPASLAVATQLGPVRVQIEACDPGIENGVAANPGVVDALIDRQQIRLTN